MDKLGIAAILIEKLHFLRLHLLAEAAAPLEGTTRRSQSRREIQSLHRVPGRTPEVSFWRDMPGGSALSSSCLYKFRALQVHAARLDPLAPVCLAPMHPKP